MASILPRASAMLGDLQRRHVFRVAVFYLAGGWGLIQVAETVIPLFLPDAAANALARGFVVLLVTGFPLAVYLGWRFDLTGDGVRVTPHRLGAAVDASVVVLPFKDLSTDHGLSQFADALTEELLHSLAAMEGMRIASRTSAFAYRDRDEDVRVIADELGVANVLEGSVRRSGAGLRVTTQLIRASDGCHLFSRTFEIDTAEGPDLQDKAGALAQEVHRAVAGGGRRRPTGSGADALARAGAALASRRIEDVEQARSLYMELLEREPGTAEAHAGLAESLVRLADLGALPRDQALRSARESARRALELDPGLASAHTTIGYAAVLAWDWDTAEHHFRRSLELEPGRPATHRRYSLLLSATGRARDALDAARQAERLDPGSPIHADAVAGLLYYNRRYPDAAEACEALLGSRPDDLYARFVLALVQEELGDYRSARESAKRAMVLAGGATAPLTLLLGHVEARAGRRSEAQRLRDEERSAAGTHFLRAGIDVALGNLDAGFLSLALALDERDDWMLSLQLHPWMDELRGDARYRDLLSGMGFSGQSTPALTEPARAWSPGPATTGIAVHQPGPGSRA